MAISVNYSLTQLNRALKKGNFYLGVGDVGKGPTSGTSYYHGITPAIGGYTLYVGQSGSNQPKIYTASTDSQLILLTNTLFGQTFTTIAECTQYYITRADLMVLNNEPGPIVTDSLSLCLIPHNTSSYNQSTAGRWFDLVNGLVFEYYNTITPLTTLNGAKGFQFNGSGYWQCGTNFSLVDLGGDCTVIMWVYGNQGGARTTIFQKNGTVAQSYEQEIAITWEGSSNFSYYSRLSPAYDYAFMETTTSSTSWSMMALKMSTGKTTNPRVGYRSKNGSAWVQDYVSRSNVALTPAGDIQIGTGYAGTCYSGGIGTVLCYNKMLSDAEILQVFNATRSYYGI
jgi:hypothetical protein